MTQLSEKELRDELLIKVDDLLLEVVTPVVRAAVNGVDATALAASGTEKVTDFILSLFREQQAEITKAFGGCTNCYGKGYATVSSFTSGSNTDWDIGGKGETIHYQNPVIKYCSCPRGQQLEQLTAPTSEGKDT